MKGLNIPPFLLSDQPYIESHDTKVDSRNFCFNFIEFIHLRHDVIRSGENKKHHQYR